MMMMSGGEAKPSSGNNNKNDDDDDEEEEEADLEEDAGVAEEASPISSRPPATAAVGSSPSSSTRWPRQETLALLHIRSQMDSAFRDSSILKAPLWEHVSRKMEEMGYKRGAKKCKEKFENVQKYYKRTKERQEEKGRPDGKNYKFFSQLDALHHNTAPSPSTRSGSTIPAPADTIPLPSHLLHDHPPLQLPPAPAPAHYPRIVSDHEPRLGFSTPSSSQGEEGDEMEMEMGMGMELESPQREGQKRKRRDGWVDGDDDQMMGFIEGLMREVMQKQEAMQRRFLDAIEKREQDRMAREEAWKRQDSARLIRDQQLMSLERAAVASRDAAIIAFLQKVTGQTITLPTTTEYPSQPVSISPLPPLFLQDQSIPSQKPSLQPKTFQAEQQSQNPSSSQSVKTVAHSLVVPEQRKKMLQEAASSRWPKVEILALIQLRSNLESRYQDSGPKGPLWEDISLGMQRLGYNRSAKRCKEKWENINKYYKKVKENNKKRQEDSKTCPYFLELDALYSKKMLGNTGSSSMDVRSLQIKESQGKDGGDIEPKTSSIADFSSLFDEHRGDQGTIGGEKQQPVGIMRTQDPQRHEKLMDYNFCDGSSSDQENGDADEDEYGDDEEQILKLPYTTQFKTQQTISSDSIGIYHTIVR